MSSSSRPVSRGVVPDLNPALGAEPAIACAARSEMVSNGLKRLAPRWPEKFWCPTHPPVAQVHEDRRAHLSGEEVAELRRRSAERDENEHELKARLEGRAQDSMPPPMQCPMQCPSFESPNIPGGLANRTSTSSRPVSRGRCTGPEPSTRCRTSDRLRLVGKGFQQA